MENTNEGADLDVGQQEEVTSQENNSFDSTGEETVTIPKSRFAKMERKARAYDSTKSTNTGETKPTTNNSSDADWKAKMELKVEGYNDDEIGFLLKNGGKEALKDDFVAKAIEAKRQQSQAERAILGDESSKSTMVGGVSTADFAKLSADEQLKKLMGQ